MGHAICSPQKLWQLLAEEAVGIITYIIVLLLAVFQSYLLSSKYEVRDDISKKHHEVRSTFMEELK